MTPLRLLHAIHDFLPRHRAGSEIYAFELCRALSRRHHVTILAAEYDLSRPHGSLAWRVYDGLTVVEIVNNWICDGFDDTYRPAALAEPLEHVLNAVQPDVLHVHNLMNLSFDLPALARGCGASVVATLHDYTLVCPSGGQRIHKAEQHLCDVIDPARCARCFPQSPMAVQMTVGRAAGLGGGATRRMAKFVKDHVPGAGAAVASVARRAAAKPLPVADIEQRLERAKGVFDDVDLFVAPSQSLGSEFVRLGVDASRLRVSDYGFVPLQPLARRPSRGPLRIAFVGTLIWHKGVHVLIDAVRELAPQTYELAIHGDLQVAPDYVADLKRRAEGLPVRFMGAFEREALAAVYSDIDLLVVPSMWPENSPLVIHEAFMAGVPIVGARIGGITELVTDQVNGLLYDPRSPDELSAVIRRLICDPIVLDALARKARAVKSIESDAEEWEGRYREVRSLKSEV